MKKIERGALAMRLGFVRLAAISAHVAPDGQEARVVETTYRRKHP